MGCIYSKYARDREEDAEEYDVIDTLESRSLSQNTLITAPIDDDGEDEKDAQNQMPSSSLRKGKLTIRLIIIHNETSSDE